MGFTGVIPIVTATSGICVGVLAWLVGGRSGPRELRILGALSVSAGGYAACDYLCQGGHSNIAVLVANHLGLAFLAAHSLAWIELMNEERLSSRPRLHRALRWVSVLIAAAACLPGVLFDGTVRRHLVEALAAEYASAVPTPAGLVVLAYFAVIAAVPLIHFGRRARHERAARMYFAAILALMLTAINDSAAGSGLLATPYLASIGLLPLIAVAGLTAVTAIDDNATRLRDLTVHLDKLVVERSTELLEAKVALSDAERLASLGKVAAGIAHEVNNPSTVVVANLAHLRDSGGAFDQLPRGRAALPHRLAGRHGQDPQHRRSAPRLDACDHRQARHTRAGQARARRDGRGRRAAGHPPSVLAGRYRCRALRSRGSPPPRTGARQPGAKRRRGSPRGRSYPRDHAHGDSNG